MSSPDDMSPVQRAEADDVSAISPLVTAAYEPFMHATGLTPMPVTADYEELIADGSVWVVHADGAVVGVLVLEDRDDHLEIANVAVSPAVRGTGVGAHLMVFAEAQARDRGYGEVRLYTNEAMTDNIAYYRRWGYRETHRGTGDGLQRVFFAKGLS